MCRRRGGVCIGVQSSLDRPRAELGVATIDSIMARRPTDRVTTRRRRRRRLGGECTTLISAFINLNNNELIFFSPAPGQAIFT